MEFRALIEEGPNESMAYFRELPGCVVSAPTVGAVLQAAPAAIEEYFRWLKQNGIVLFEEEVEPISVVLTEHQTLTEPFFDAFFDADRAAPTDQEIDNALNVGATTRALIIELVAEIPAHLHEIASVSGGWSLTEHLEHLMESETWYVSRLLEHPAEEQPGPEMDADAISLKIFENAMDYELVLRELTPEQRTHVYTHDGAEWTAGKVLRRMTGHLREHYPWMQAIARELME